MVFHRSLSDNKSPQVSRTLLSIMAVLNNVVVWMVSTRPPTSKYSSPFSNPLDTVPNVPITIGIIVTFMFHSFFNSLTRSRYLSFFSHSFSFILWLAGTAKSTILQILFFFFFLLIPNMQDTAGEARTGSLVMYSYGPPHMAGQKQDDQSRTYIQQLCEDTGCSPEDLPEAMNDWEEWREWVRDIRACGMTR